MKSLVVAESRMGRFRLPGLTPSRRERAVFLAFIAPNFLLFGIFTFWPLLYNVYLSFMKWNMIAPRKQLVWLDNYVTMAQDPIFWKVLWNTVYLAAGSITIRLILALGLALLLNQKLAGRAVYRAIIFSPTFTTGAAIALVWTWIFHKQLGLLRLPLDLLGITSPGWLTDIHWTIPALIIVTVWKGLGYDMVIFLAGLQGIPAELYEAARVDGAGAWGLFRHVTLPMLSPITFFLIVTSIINALQIFDIVAVMTGGGPLNSSKVYVYYIYENAFKWFKVGYASALSVVLFLVTLGVTMVQTRLSRRWVHY
jgi:multiple sugar transport system permease protein/sn-glycerol 3-phosphate transport system permease protein